MKRHLLLGAMAFGLPVAAQTSTLASQTTFRFETLRLPAGESMGLLGLSRTFDLGGFRLGPGLYGAVRGNRGGFFTFGLEGAYAGSPLVRLPLVFEAGLYVGGGGGAAAPQGGGLMLRPHLGVAFLGSGFRLGLELSRVRFPNGNLDSTQAALVLGFQSRRPWQPEGGWGSAPDLPVSWSGRSLALTVRRLEPTAPALTRSGRPMGPLDLAGLTLDADLRGPLFRFVALEGAAGGAHAGYAQATAGLGLRSDRVGPFFLEARLGAGMGGGGDLDTGGGALLQAEGGLGFGGIRWHGLASLGLLRAPAGQLRSRTIGFRLARQFAIAVPAAGGARLDAGEAADWRIGTGFQVYRRVQRPAGDGEIQLLTLRVDRMLAGGFYLSGEAATATGGGAGGFSTGLAGLGWETPAWARQRLFLEAGIGAGGGGGVRSGGGLIASVRGGWRLDLPAGLGLDATAGRIRAPRGDLASAAFGLGFHLRFRTFER